MRSDELERRLQERLDALGPAPRAELLHVLMFPTSSAPTRSDSYWGNPKTRTFAELLIDCEQDRTLRCSPGCCTERRQFLPAVSSCQLAIRGGTIGGYHPWISPQSSIP